MKKCKITMVVLSVLLLINIVLLFVVNSSNKTGLAALSNVGTFALLLISLSINLALYVITVIIMSIKSSKKK